MAAITISREFGSDGDRIASDVAQSLGYHFVDRRFIGNVISQFGYVEFDKEYSTLPTFWERFDAQREKDRDAMVSLLNRVIQAVAHHGNVIILGRSGFEVLGGFADVLHVRLRAPFAARVQRIMKQQDLSYDAAEILVRQNDRVRVAFVEEFYRVPWNSLQAFDLVINTAKIAPELAAEMIVDAAQFFEPGVDTQRATVAALQVDHVLAGSVSQMMHCEKIHTS